MELNQLCLSLLEYLLENNGTCKTIDAVQALHISKRSLQYQIEKLNAFLQYKNLNVITSINDKLRISMESQSTIDAMLLCSDIHTWYFLTSQERLTLISILIAIHQTPTTTDALSEQIQVSKNTIVTDVTLLRKKIRSVGLALIPNHKNGYEIQGDEMTLRLYILDCVHMYYTNKYSKQYIDTFLDSIFTKNLHDLDVTKMRTLLEETLANQEPESMFHYTSDAKEEIILHIMIMLLRHHSKQLPIYVDEISHLREYQLADDILKKLYTFRIFSDNYESDRNYLTTILLSSKINVGIPEIFIEQDLLSFTDLFLKNFEMLTFIHLEHLEDLKENLLLHIRPMYYRLKYNIKIHNVLNDEIQANYALFFNLTKKAIELSCINYSFQIPDDEIAYLCVYLAGWINQVVSHMEQKNATDTLLIVIPGGNSMSSLIQLQLMNLLKPMYFNYEIISSHQFDEQLASNYPLVLCNIPYNGTCSNIIPISAYLTESQRNRIVQWSIQYANLNNNDEITHLIDIIKTHCTINEEEILKAKLFNFLNQTPICETQILSLLQVIKPSSISLVEDSLNIDKLLIQATHDFVVNDVVKALYVPNIMNILNTMGAYGEITTGVLLLHAENVSLCNKLGVHICNLKIPQQLKNNPTPIHTIVFLSTPDKTSHLKILKDLSQLFRDADFLNKLKDFSYRNNFELFRDIKALLSGE